MTTHYYCLEELRELPVVIWEEKSEFEYSIDCHI